MYGSRFASFKNILLHFLVNIDYTDDPAATVVPARPQTKKGTRDDAIYRGANKFCTPLHRTTHDRCT